MGISESGFGGGGPVAAWPLWRGVANDGGGPVVCVIVMCDV